jgi:REP element-mobilizing transposase RayT
MDIKNRITGEVYFVTDTVLDWVEIFKRPFYRHNLIDSLQYCQKEKGLIIYAWGFMTNHMHMMVESIMKNIISYICLSIKRLKVLRTL